MVRETGIVVARQSNCLWVETIQRSTCGSCVARQGCGQFLLSRLVGINSRIKVLPANSIRAANVQVGDEVIIGIPDDVLVKSALLVYFLPLLGLVAGALVGQVWLRAEWAAMLLGCSGLVLGGLLVRLQAWRYRNDPGFSPVMLDE